MSQFIVPEVELPEWLNAEFFRSNLNLAGEVSLKSVKFGCAKGENFASMIFRVELETRGKSRSLIVKTRPVGGLSEEYSKKFSIFPKETEMYAIIDRFEKIYSSIGSEITFAPK